MSRFFCVKEDSDTETESSEDEVEEQQIDTLKRIIKQNRDAKSVGDLRALSKGFDSLVKAFKSSNDIFQQQVTIPRFYIRSLVEVDDYVNNLWADEEAKAALSRNNAKALPAIRQKLKKYVENEKLDTLIAEYRANPDEEGYETSENESNDDSEENPGVKNDNDDGDPRRCVLKEGNKTSAPSSSNS